MYQYIYIHSSGNAYLTIIADNREDAESVLKEILLYNFFTFQERAEN